jgi:hypothetical protein
MIRRKDGIPSQISLKISEMIREKPRKQLQTISTRKG